MSLSASYASTLLIVPQFSVEFNRHSSLLSLDHQIQREQTATSQDPAIQAEQIGQVR